ATLTTAIRTMSPTRMDLPFLPEALVLTRVVLLPLETIAVMLNIVGPNEEGGSGFSPAAGCKHPV
ncbi:MAG: hypothetical protein WBN03_18940, partial [Desulfobacterales bacterium]